MDAAGAQTQQAEINLGFTTIRSPIEGKAGLAKAQLGDLVGPSSGALTSVSKSIRSANFAVSEQVVYKSLERDAAAGGSLNEASSRWNCCWPGATFTLKKDGSNSRATRWM